MLGFPFPKMINDKEMLQKQIDTWHMCATKQHELYQRHGMYAAVIAQLKLCNELHWVGELWEMAEETQPQPEAAEDEMQLA